MSYIESKLTRMRVYYFRCYWPLSMLFLFRCMSYISNLRKIGQKVRSLYRQRYILWTVGQTKVRNQASCKLCFNLHTQWPRTQDKRSLDVKRKDPQACLIERLQENIFRAEKHNLQNYVSQASRYNAECNQGVQQPIPTTISTCAQKRTSSQLSLPHGTVN